MDMDTEMTVLIFSLDNFWINKIVIVYAHFLHFIYLFIFLCLEVRKLKELYEKMDLVSRIC